VIGRAFLLGAAFAVAATASFAQTKAAPSGAAKAAAQSPIDRDFKTVCGSCHNTGLVTTELRSRADWMQTLEAMLERGATGTNDQIDNVVRYLDANLTKLNVNVAGQDEIGSVLDLPDAVAAAVVKRRSELVRFKSLDEIKAVPGVDAAKIDYRKARISF
jgi:competence protein ComEA